MKVRELLEQEKIIRGPLLLPADTARLKYKGAVIEGNFNCSATQIVSLEGAPSRVTGSFYCNDARITSLKGAPSHVGDMFYCYDTKITSLHDVHKQIKHIGGKLILSNTIVSHVLGVMFIKGLKAVIFHKSTQDQRRVEEIITGQLQGDRDIHQAQEEMIEAGLGDYAKL